MTPSQTYTWALYPSQTCTWTLDPSRASSASWQCDRMQYFLSCHILKMVILKILLASAITLNKQQHWLTMWSSWLQWRHPSFNAKWTCDCLIYNWLQRLPFCRFPFSVATPQSSRFRMRVCGMVHLSIYILEIFSVLFRIRMRYHGIGSLSYFD